MISIEWYDLDSSKHTVVEMKDLKNSNQANSLLNKQKVEYPYHM